MFGLLRKKQQNTGLWGEEIACNYLKKHGYKILGKRVRFGPRAELDIVARDGEELVFVEVKTRANEDFGSPASAVKRDKRRFLSRAAVRYIKKIKNPDINFRFDIIEVIGLPCDKTPEVRHIDNAFTLDPRYIV